MNTPTRSRMAFRALWLLLSALAAGPAMAQDVVYYHTDALGTPVAMTDANGAVIQRREFEPYGYQLDPAPLADGPGFTGHVSDAATGLVYMQQRYYDPLCGCFISTDPVSALGGGTFNEYWYANANPFGLIDPDGRQAQTNHSCGEQPCPEPPRPPSNRRPPPRKPPCSEACMRLRYTSANGGTKAQAQMFFNFIRDEGLNVLGRTADVVGGLGQIGLGGAICAGVVTCAGGSLLAAQGASNVYEGWTGNPSTLRGLYQGALGERGGNIAYASVDVATSGYGLFRPVLKPGSWKLFRYTRDQYMPAARALTGTQAAIEAGGAADDVNDLYGSTQH